MVVSSQIETSVHIERHYAVTEIAEMWNLSPDKVRELFEREAGVLVIRRIESAAQAALPHFARSAFSRRTRSHSVVIEIRIAVRDPAYAHSLSKTSQEMQTA